MNDDLIAILEGMGGALDQIGPLMERLDRIEAQQQEILDALNTIAEITVRTFAATGTTDTLPDEVLDAPIMEQAMTRNPQLHHAKADMREARRDALARIDKSVGQIREKTAALKADMQRAPAPDRRPAPTLLDRVAQRVLQTDRERRDRDREQDRDEDLCR